MKILTNTLMRKLHFKFSKEDLSKISVEDESQYLSSFPMPSDDVERSYFQYKCQMKFKSKAYILFYNIASFPFFLKQYYFGRYKGKSRVIDNPNDTQKNIAVHFDLGNALAVPLSLKEEFDEFIAVEKIEGKSSKSDKNYFKNMVLKRYPFSYYFLLKNYLKMSEYSNILNTYHPKAIVVCDEYSFTSSFLTSYCNSHQIEHINVMHGEKVFNIRDSFFHFNRCFVWDNYYIELFLRLKAYDKQFRVAIPPNLVLKRNGDSTGEKNYDYTYYLQIEDIPTLIRIASELKRLIKMGNRVCYRPHPLYENEHTKELLHGIDREDCNLISIKDSIFRTRHVISRYSTVLYQAYLNEVPVVIDDITDPVLYKNLKDQQYIMLNKQHVLLSQVINTAE